MPPPPDIKAHRQAQSTLSATAGCSVSFPSLSASHLCWARPDRGSFSSYPAPSPLWSPVQGPRLPVPIPQHSDAPDEGWRERQERMKGRGRRRRGEEGGNRVWSVSGVCRNNIQTSPRATKKGMSATQICSLSWLNAVGWGWGEGCRKSPVPHSTPGWQN